MTATPALASSPPLAEPIVGTPPSAKQGPLRIVIVVPYNLAREPFTIRTIRFSEELARRGHQVTLFQAKPQKKPKGMFHPEPPKGVTVHALRYKRPSFWRLFNEAVRGADVVHFQKSGLAQSIISMMFARLYDKPLHQDWDDYESYFWFQALRDLPRRKATPREWMVAIKSATASTVLEWLIPKVADTMGVSSTELRLRSQQWGAAPANIFPARVGVDVEVFSPSCRDERLRQELGVAGHPTLLYSGCLELLEDLQFFITALRRAFERVPQARCLVVGGGFGRAAFVQMLQESGLVERVRLTPGFIPFAQMPGYLASCEVAALPFRDTRVNRAKSSLTLMECMAAGLPVVTHDVGDMAWVAGDGGLVAPLGDPLAFGDSLAILLEDEAHRSKMGNAGRARVAEHFTWSRSVDYLEAAYRTATARHAHGEGGALA